LIDAVVEEPKAGAHHDHVLSAANFKKVVLSQINELKKLSTEDMLEARYQKFRSYGEWQGE